ncbi:unnamed protein product [Rhizoctonia solani]|uniref:DH domain-containing protein n=2 Tax=Rhizoctonia solani TaxID=456999 RepID=A0A8H3GXE9_9AGAM|nr:RhoGEF domain protein [Rhizoctonia solani AG-3 Rhs1AP]CAE6478409.1 unnamed protein product [Rhizoctonia solani]CAE6488425.1 unnamed protein product [Rhizoctonia solani]
MKAFIRKLRRERSRERGDEEEKVPPPLPPKTTMRADDSWLKHVSAPALSLPPLLPPTPTSAPLPATATPTPVPTPPATTPVPPAPQQRPVSPPLHAHAQTHSTASSRPSQASEHGPDSAARRKVAFRSPPPTPGTIPVPLPEPESEQIQIPLAPPQSPSHSQSQPQTTTTTYYRMRPNSATARFREGNSTPPKINTSGRTTAASGRVTHSPTQSTRTYPNEAASMTIRSGTPYSHMSGTSAIQAAASWSEAAENDLVSNLGSRERTRQEVLWEIVASEERYVGELIKLKETFLDSLLHPFAPVRPVPSLYHTAETSTFLDEERASLRRAASPAESVDHLPIAARFLSPTPGPASSSTHHTRAETPRSKYRAPTIDEAEDSYDSDDEGKLPSRRRQTPSGGKSPYGTAAQRRAGSGKVPVPFPARSHQSLPPQPTRNHTAAASSHSLGRQLCTPDNSERKGASGLKQRFQRRAGSRDMSASASGVTAQQLPEDLRVCLEVLEEVILPGHLTLREGLQKRYEEQYPLVRSLADIFVAHSHILRGYAKYVLHLERALEQVDNALSATNVTKRPRNQDAAQWAQVCKALQRLEEVAADKCETGLAISLSKPFQRLLKYPLLFQNLLFQTDPSTHDYESTLEMVAEVERIVRSIEDEKIQKEERDRTWDVFARIEGLEKIKQLAVPKPSRLLVNERPLHPDPTAPDMNRTVAGTPTSTPSKNTRGKSSLRRISDALQSGSGKKDLWLVSFNDVVLRCQRTGVTTMPLVSGSPGDRLPSSNGGKSATVGRRTQVRPRNMYKFIKIETWTIGDVSKPRAGVVSMEDITKTRTGVSIEDMALHNRAPIQEDDDEDEGAESDESDRKSKMSFSYWGADRITVQPTARGPNGVRVPVRRIPGAQAAYLRDARTESSANAKFGTRLRESSTPERPTSRTGAGSRAGGRRSESAKPAWGAMTPIPGSRRGSASLSPSAAPPVASSSTTPRKSTVSASPAPSVDSGIAVYLAQDRS